MGRRSAGAGRAMGVDYGRKRVGVALSDGLGLAANPLEVLEAGPGVEVRLAELVNRHDVTRVVIGLPVSLDGSERAPAQQARRFAERMKKVVDAEVILYDERFTTRIAEGVMLEAGMSRAGRRKRLDKVAAAVLLQGYLDREAENLPA